MNQNQFLSLNEHCYKGNFGLPEEDEESAEALRAPMKLKDTWVLWEQQVVENAGKTTNYQDATRKVVSFNTVQEFIAIWNGLPQPSELLEQKRIMRKDGNSQAVAIDAFMIFKEGISPEWEHPANANGGHFQVQLKPTVGGPQIDEYWNNTVLGMIGGTIEPADIITVIRLVDKMTGSKVANGIRIELWFAKYNESNVNSLKRSMEKCMGQRLDGSMGTVPKPDMKPHGSIGKH